MLDDQLWRDRSVPRPRFCGSGAGSSWLVPDLARSGHLGLSLSNGTNKRRQAATPSNKTTTPRHTHTPTTTRRALPRPNLSHFQFISTSPNTNRRPIFLWLSMHPERPSSFSQRPHFLGHFLQIIRHILFCFVKSCLRSSSRCSKSISHQSVFDCREKSCTCEDFFFNVLHFLISIDSYFV